MFINLYLYVRKLDCENRIKRVNFFSLADVFKFDVLTIFENTFPEPLV